MLDNVRVGFSTGTGSAINVSLGWIPDYVHIINFTDADRVDMWHRSMGAGYSVPISTAVGAVLSTNGIREYAGVAEEGSKTMSYTSGGAYVMAVGNTIIGNTSGATAVITGRTITSGTDAGTDAVGLLTVYNVTGRFQSSETLQVGTNTDVATLGTIVVPRSAGFTIGSTISENAKVLHWFALRNLGPEEYNADYLTI